MPLIVQEGARDSQASSLHTNLVNEIIVIKPSCLFTVTLTSMTSLVLDLEQKAHMFWTLTDLSA